MCFHPDVRDVHSCDSTPLPQYDGDSHVHNALLCPHWISNQRYETHDFAQQEFVLALWEKRPPLTSASEIWPVSAQLNL